MSRFFISLAVASLLSGPAVAAACRDAKGKFVTCPKVTVTRTTTTTKTSGTKCRDAKGHFARCGTPGSKPA